MKGNLKDETTLDKEVTLEIMFFFLELEPLKKLSYVFNPLFVIKIPETRYTKRAVTVCFLDPSFYWFWP